MKIKKVSTTLNDYITIDEKDIVGMDYQQKLDCYFKVMHAIPELDPKWFDKFLRWALDEFGTLEVVEMASKFPVEDSMYIQTLEV